mmetsp:Transcript_23504/g.69166  ORF Transcript_23504/g.69166 Transcript_23504/m.69166 type:complete len:182 (-) Transcript_23504:130-675(-)
MSHVHVGHDCSVGPRVVLASRSSLAGHVTVGEGAQVSGHACVHQRVSIGGGAFVAAAAVLLDDLLPYGLAAGASRATVDSLNMRGIRRLRTPPAEQRAMLRAFRHLFLLPRRTSRFEQSAPPPRLALLSVSERAAALLAEVAEAAGAAPTLRLVEMLRFVRDHAGPRGLCLPSSSAGVSEL